MKSILSFLSLYYTTTTFSLSPANAFILPNTQSTFLSSSSTTIINNNKHSSALRAELLEGWKVDGTVTPVNNFVLVKLADIQEQTDSGILLSKTAKIVKTEGKVISVGPGKPHKDSGILYPMPVQSGDGVVYGKYDGTIITIDGVRHSLIRDDDILVKFNTDTLTLDSVEAVNDFVLVQIQMKEEESSAGGLLLAPLNSKGGESKRPSTGVVKKVGPGRMIANGEIVPFDVKVGDTIKFRDFAGFEVTIEGEDYSVVRMSEILAKF